jgi:hypothetical protein
MRKRFVLSHAAVFVSDVAWAGAGERLVVCRVFALKKSSRE